MKPRRQFPLAKCCTTALASPQVRSVLPAVGQSHRSGSAICRVSQGIIQGRGISGILMQSAEKCWVCWVLWTCRRLPKYRAKMGQASFPKEHILKPINMTTSCWPSGWSDWAAGCFKECKARLVWCLGLCLLWENSMVLWVYHIYSMRVSWNVVQVRSHVQPVKLALLLLQIARLIIRRRANLIQYARCLHERKHPLRAWPIHVPSLCRAEPLQNCSIESCLVWNAARAPAPFTWNFPMLQSRWVTSRPT